MIQFIKHNLTLYICSINKKVNFIVKIKKQKIKYMKLKIPKKDLKICTKNLTNVIIKKFTQSLFIRTYNK